MKAFLVLAVLIAVTCAADEEQETLGKKFTEKIRRKQKECKKDYPSISDENYQKLTNSKKMPSTKDEKCFATCYAKKMGYMNKKGKMNLERLKKANTKRFKKAENIKLANELVTTCVEEVKTETDECETGANFLMCWARKSRQRGLKLPKYHPEVPA